MFSQSERADDNAPSKESNHCSGLAKNFDPGADMCTQFLELKI